MKTIFLHAGRHKTGTSSLQQFFSKNRELLIANDIFYPHSCMSGHGHHLLAKALSVVNKDILAPEDFNEIREVRDIQTEIERATQNKILISSEAFQNTPPQNVARAFEKYKVTVVMYLRDQVSYLTSSYSQSIHASGLVLDIEEYHDRVMSNSMDYDRFLAKWEEAFPGALSLSVYDRRMFINFNIIDDFFHRHLKIKSFTSVNTLNSNPSLSLKYVILKKKLNYILPPGYTIDTAGLYNLFSEMSEKDGGEKLSLGNELREKLRDKYFDINSSVSNRYFSGKQLFHFGSAIENAPESVTFNEFVSFINELVRGKPSVGGLKIYMDYYLPEGKDPDLRKSFWPQFNKKCSKYDQLAEAFHSNKRSYADLKKRIEDLSRAFEKEKTELGSRFQDLSRSYEKKKAELEMLEQRYLELEIRSRSFIVRLGASLVTLLKRIKSA